MAKRIRNNIKTSLKKERTVEKDIIEKDDDELIDDEFNDEEEGYLSDEEVARVTEEFKKEALPHINLLHNYAYKMTGNQLDADDLLQETYLRAFRFFHKFERGTNCKAWLFRIMKNLFINNYRKNQKSPNKVDYDEVENFFENIKSDKIDSTDLQEKVFNNLLDDNVTHALNSLQDDYKTVVILCDLEGLSYEEIAEFLDVPIGTIRSRLHRGRKILQKKLSDYAKQKGYAVETEA